jgi:hypothetical protein
MEVDWYSEFPLRLLSRAIMKKLGFTDEQIALITDDDMYTIASEVEQACLKSQTGLLWPFMRQSVASILKGKTDGK